MASEIAVIGIPVVDDEDRPQRSLAQLASLQVIFAMNTRSAAWPSFGVSATAVLISKRDNSVQTPNPKSGGRPCALILFELESEADIEQMCVVHS